MLDHWGAVLDAIAAGARAWSPAEQIVIHTSLSGDEVDEALYELAGNGMAEEWPGFGWTLSPLAAEILNVFICSDNLTGRGSWGPEPPPARPSRAAKLRTEAHAAAVESAVDPAPGPAEPAERAEESWAPARPFDVENLPRPAVFMTGPAARPWRERPPRVAGRPRRRDARPYQCKLCKGLHINVNAYCGECDRWGFDGLAAAKRRAAETHARRAAG